MSGSLWGQYFRCLSFGESHGAGIGVVIDGCPSGHHIDHLAIQHQLNRRRPGQSKWSSPRDEKDRLQFLSGIEAGITLGTPLCMYVANDDARPQDYLAHTDVLRPSHADYTYLAKYGIKAASGGGRASARETIARVASGALAEQLIQARYKDFASVAWVDSIADIEAQGIDYQSISRDEVDAHPLRIPDKGCIAAAEAKIQSHMDHGDSVGGTIRGILRGLPAGLGEPVFQKFEALLAQAMLSLPAVKGFEIGSGFAGTLMSGSAHNDPFYWDQDNNRVRTSSNHSGGIQGGISNGELIYYRVAFKPVSSIRQPQESLTTDGKALSFKIDAGRHDPCVLPRAVAMVESMATLCVIELILAQLRNDHYATANAQVYQQNRTP